MTILTYNRTERPFAVDCVIREVLTRNAKDGLGPGGPQSAVAIGCYVAEVPLARSLPKIAEDVTSYSESHESPSSPSALLSSYVRESKARTPFRHLRRSPLSPRYLPAAE